MTKNKLFLVDALAMIYRAHFAFLKNPRVNSKGQNISAIFGFMNSLLEILEKEKPSHIAVAFDSYEPTARSESYTDYKANRDKQPEDITFAIPVIKQILTAMNIPVLELAGYEADDLIATISEQVPPESFNVYMFTPDKDYAQLVRDHVFLYKPGNKDKGNEIWDTARVLKEFNIKRIDQVIEIQGLMGDAVDNIPGIPGVGPKTAQQLIAEYDHIENLLQNKDKLKGKLKELVGQYGEQALMSRELARLLRDAPLTFDEASCKLQEWNSEQLEAVFAELEFKALSKRMLGKETVKQVVPVEGQLSFTFDNTSRLQESEILTVSIADFTEEQLQNIKSNIEKAGRISFSFSHDLNDPYQCRIQAFAFSYSGKESYTIAFGKEESKTQHFFHHFKQILENQTLKKYGYNLKFAYLALKKYNIQLAGPLMDAEIMHYIIDPESSHEYNRLCETYLQKSIPVQNTLFNVESINVLAAKAIYNLELGEVLMQKIEAQGMKELYDQIEGPLIEVLANMEYAGVRINEDELAVMSKQMREEMDLLEKKVFLLSGISFNINSPQQLGHVLFDKLHLDPNAKKTKKGGQYSTNEEVLQKLAEKHEIARVMLEYRGLQKLKSTYIDALPLMVNKSSGMIHTSYEQAVTSTGRLSSKNPNLQNIPVRTDRGRQIRKAFIAREHNRKIISADYSQIELRVIAHMSEDTNMMVAFRNNIDIHTATAARVFKVTLDQVSPEMRRKAKEVNFGIIYGISAWGLSQRLNISRTEATEIIDQYYHSYPDILAYIQFCIDKARKTFYAETLFKRRRYLRDINSRNAMQRSFAERNAINAPVQGSAADIIKIAMIRINQHIKEEKLNSRMIMQVHDELVFDVVHDEIDIMTKLIRSGMENAAALKVPLIVDMGIADNWLDAH